MKIVLLGNPISTNTIYKRHGNFIYMSKEGKALKQSYQFDAKRQWLSGISLKEFEINIKLYFKDKKRRDIDNYNKILLDSLTGIVWKDDSQIKKMTIEKFIGYGKGGIEIEID